MYLKEDCVEFLQQSKLQQLIKQYSEFISFPIKLLIKDSVPREIIDDVATATAQEAADKAAAEKGEVRE